MTAPAPATEAPPAADALAVVSPTTAITKLQVLAGDIAQAQEQAVDKKFNYADKKQNAACRSYLATLRTYNGRIDDAHKEAKADNLVQGRQIDAVKNALKERVAALIQPHKDALDDIARKEAERVAGHQEVINMIKDAARLPFGSTSQQIAEIHRDIGALDLSDMEEFEVEAKAAWADTIQALTAAHKTAQEAEGKEVELARLREEARLQAERDAEAKRIKDEEDAAAEVARKAQEAADAAALLVIEEAEQKAALKLAEAEAALAAANRRAEDAEAVADALQGEALLAIKPAGLPAAVTSDRLVASVYGGGQKLVNPAPTPEAVATPTRVDAELALQQELHNALAGRKRAEVVAALIAGTLHPAVRVDWNLVAGGQG